MTGYLDENDPTNLANVVKDLLGRVNQLEKREVVFQALDEVTSDLGDQRAGRFLALLAGSEPTDEDATGVALSADAIAFGKWLVNLMGVNLGRLMFGGSAETGAFMTGGGKVVQDDKGMTIFGLESALNLEAVALNALLQEVKRFGHLEMIVPDGSSTPALALTFKDDASGDNLLSNGDFSSGDMAGWTPSGDPSLFEVIADEGPTGVGSYVLKSNSRPAGSETFTSDPISVSAGEKYDISIWTKDIYQELELPIVANGVLDSRLPTFAYDSMDKTNKANWWLASGYLLGQEKQRALLKWDPTGYSNVDLLTLVELKLFLKKTGNSIGTNTIDAFLVKTDWDPESVCWDNSASETPWQTGGCGGALDRDSESLGSMLFTAAGMGEDYIYWPLSPAKFQELVDGSVDDFGLVLVPTTESGNNCVELGTIAEGLGASIVLTERSMYTIEAWWYDGAGGTGALIRKDRIATQNGKTDWNERLTTLTAPTGAMSVTTVITGAMGREFLFGDCWIKEVSLFSRIILSPDFLVQDRDGIRKALSVKKELPTPATCIAALEANLARGNSSFLNTYINSSQSVSHVIQDNPDRILITGIIASKSGTFSIGTATYNGKAMTPLYNSFGTWQTGGEYYDFGLFYILNPDVGTHDIVITNGTPTYGVILSIDYYGANQDDPIHGLEIINETVSSPSTLMTIDAVLSNSLIVAFHGFMNSTTNPASVAPLVEIIEKSEGTYGIIAGISDLDAASGTGVQFSWASGNPKHVIAGFELRANSGGEHVSTGKTAGTHKYKVNIIDESGETDASPASSTITNDATYKYNIVRRPVFTEGMTGWRVYGTKAGEDTPFYFLGELGVNDLVFTDSYPDEEYGTATPPLVNTSSARPQHPRLYEIPAVTLRTTATKTDTAEIGGIKSEVLAANSYDGLSLEGSAWIADGTYSMIVLGMKGVDRGKIDWYIDETKVVSLQDWYNASAVVYSFPDSNIVILGNGYHKIRAVVNGRHASSSNFAVSLYKIILFSNSY